jgi:hypothetical protein
MKSPYEQFHSLQQMRSNRSISASEYEHMLNILLKELEKKQKPINDTMLLIQNELVKLKTTDHIGNEKIISIIVTILIIVATIIALVAIY